MEASVVVPWRSDPHREVAWQWVRSQYEALGFEVVTGSCPDGPWVKALAVDDAVQRSSGELLIVADADVWCAQLPDVLHLAETRPVVMPHGQVHRLTQSESQRFMAGERGHFDTVEPPRKGMAGGGIVILSRDLWEQVPMDPRFVGWGQEDRSWSMALTAMTGKIARFSHHLVHLWHPPQPRLDRATGSHEGRALEARYAAASRDPVQMGALLTEARQTLRRPGWHSPRSLTSKPA